MVTVPYIAVPTQDGLSAILIAAMKVYLPDWRADESDPGTYWADLTAGDRLQFILQVNESADAVWVETSTGDALNRHLRNVSLEPFDGESNLSKRRRYYAQWDALAKDTPEYAKALAVFADPLVVDVDVELTTPVGEEQRFNTWVAYEDIIDPTVIQKEAIAEYMNAPSRRPLWLRYIMQDITYIDYSIDGTITYRHGTRNPTEQCIDAITARVILRQKLNTAISVSDLESAGYIDEDILNVRLTSPVNDLSKVHGTIYRGTIGNIVVTEDTE